MWSDPFSLQPIQRGVLRRKHSSLLVLEETSTMPKEDDVMTECACCLEELPVGDTYTCKTCELDPLCVTCITNHPDCANSKAADIGSS